MATIVSQLAAHPGKKPQQIVTQESKASIPKQTNQPIKQPARIVYSITYALPGQVGFCVPQITEDRDYIQLLQALLKQERWVINEQVNRNAGSILISYKPGLITDAEMRSHLANLIQSAGGAEVATSTKITTPAVTQKSFKLNSQPQPATPVAQTNKPAKQPPAKIAYSIAHAIPGRVRFRIPRIAKDPEYVKRLKALLKADDQVTSERVNSAAVSIIITYKFGVTQDSKMRRRNLLEYITHLARLIQSASDATAVSA